MKKTRLLAILTAAGLAGITAHAQYAAPRADAYAPSASPVEWEIDAGVGYLAGTNLPGADNGVAGHIGGYYLDPLDATHETTLKYGAEFFGSDATGKSGGADVDLTTYFVSADMGVTYRFSRHFEVGILGGVGVGGAEYKVGGNSASTALFGYQIRPEITAWITEKIGVSLSYRFFQAAALDSAWNKNPVENAVEFSVKVRF